MNKIIIATTVAFMVFAGSFAFAANDTMMQAQTAYGHKHSYPSENNAPISKQDQHRYREQDQHRYREQDQHRYREQDHHRYREQDHHRYRNRCPYCNCRQGYRDWHSK